MTAMASALESVCSNSVLGHHSPVVHPRVESRILLLLPPWFSYQLQPATMLPDTIRCPHGHSEWPLPPRLASYLSKPTPGAQAFSSTLYPGGCCPQPSLPLTPSWSAQYRSLSALPPSLATSPCRTEHY